MQLDAPLGEQWHQLARIAARNGESELASGAMEKFVGATGGSHQAQYLKASLLEQLGRLPEALRILSALPPNFPDPAANAYSRGTAALFLGRAEEAREQLIRATQLMPGSGSAWLSLTMAVDPAAAPEVAEAVIAAEGAVRAQPPAQRASWWYARGRVHAARAEYEDAFFAFSAGAREMKGVAPHDRNAEARRVAEATMGHSAASVAEISRQQTVSSSRTIFVTGSPRTGTTLVEQILTSHSKVSDGGEINRLPILAHEVGGVSGEALARFVENRDPSEAVQLWDHLIEQRFPGADRVVDKTLNTTRFLGLAAALLPEAPIIWLTRDPLDCAWSCFRTFFPVSMSWSYDLEDIAAFLQQERRLLEQWRDILGERLLIVPYESLVDQPVEWTRRILVHCGLPEEEQVFAPHANGRTVTTASVMQVRRPINREGVGAAEPYRDFLRPFVDAYYS